MQALETFIGEFTLNDLAQRSGKSVNEIVAFAMGETLPKTPKPVTLKEAATVTDIKKAKKGRHMDDSTSTVETRTPEGRAAYDEAVLSHLRANKGQWMGAGEVRKACGGSALQVRTSLGRLLENESVEYEGEARGTKYRVK